MVWAGEVPVRLILARGETTHGRHLAGDFAERDSQLIAKMGVKACLLKTAWGITVAPRILEMRDSQ